MPVSAKVILKKRHAGAPIGRHPWLFAGWICEVQGDVKDGDPVAVYSGDDGSFLAYGLYNSRSDIRVRLYSFEENQPVGEALFRVRLDAAIELRRLFYGSAEHLSARRLVFSESDGLSGLVVDQYGPYLVLQVTSFAIYQRLEMIVQALKDLVQPKGIFLRAESSSAKKDGLSYEAGVLFGEIPEAPVLIEEHGIKMEVYLREGQKTGLYLDQRENHQMVSQFAPGRNMLDLYCYTGGFSLHSARAGAKKVVGVDSSEWALAQGRRNADLNSLTTINFFQMDAFDFLRANSSQRYSLIVLDPPRFGASRDSKENALRMYHALNTEAFKVLDANGILVSCSCSGRVSYQEFISLLSSVARRMRRTLQILEQRGAAPDHFYSSSCPESQYLKCVIARVV